MSVMHTMRETTSYRVFAGGRKLYCDAPEASQNGSGSTQAWGSVPSVCVQLTYINSAFTTLCPGPLKLCSKCRSPKFTSEYFRERNGKYGVKSECKICFYVRKKANRKRETVWQRAGAARRHQDLRVNDPLTYRARKAASGANQRAARQGISGRLTGQDVLDVWHRDQFQCQADTTCSGIGIDHKKPMCKGGPNAVSNLQTMCAVHNCKKARRVE